MLGSCRMRRFAGHTKYTNELQRLEVSRCGNAFDTPGTRRGGHPPLIRTRGKHLVRSNGESTPTPISRLNKPVSTSYYLDVQETNPLDLVFRAMRLQHSDHSAPNDLDVEVKGVQVLFAVEVTSRSVIEWVEMVMITWVEGGCN